MIRANCIPAQVTAAARQSCCAGDKGKGAQTAEEQLRDSKGKGKMVEPVEEEDEDDEEEFDEDVSNSWQMPCDTLELYIHLFICCYARQRRNPLMSTSSCPTCMHPQASHATLLLLPNLQVACGFMMSKRQNLTNKHNCTKTLARWL